MKKGFGVDIRDENGDTVRNNMYWEQDVERIGGIGALIESIEPLLKGDETIKVEPVYYK